jgi:hypothetical protein
MNEILIKLAIAIVIVYILFSIFGCDSFLPPLNYEENTTVVINPPPDPHDRLPEGEPCSGCHSQADMRAWRGQ